MNEELIALGEAKIGIVTFAPPSDNKVLSLSWSRFGEMVEFGVFEGHYSCENNITLVVEEIGMDNDLTAIEIHDILYGESQ